MSTRKPWYEIRNQANGVELYIYGSIGRWDVSASMLMAELRMIGENTPITVKICSDGGSVLEGNEIANLLKRHKGGVTCEAGSICASIATVIAIAGQKVRMAKNGLWMIHNVSVYTEGDSEALRKMADLMDKMNVGIAQAYADKTGKPLDEIKALMAATTWYTADEALANGFVDEIIEIEIEEEEESEELDPENFVHLAAFKNFAGNMKSKPASANASPGTGNGKGSLQNEPANQSKPTPKKDSMTPEEIEAKIKADAEAKAAEMFKAKLKRDAEIDDIVLALRKRDGKDFGELAAKAKAENKSADAFAREVATSDQYKPFKAEAIGGAIEVVGERSRILTPGEAFVNSASYKDLGNKTGARRSIVVDMGMPEFLNTTTTSSGLTSIQKLPGVVELGQRRLRIKDLLAAGATNSTTIRYIKEDSFTNAATAVAEGSAKPEASFALSEVDAPVKKIAAYTKVSDELFADYLQVASYINGRLPYMVERTEEDQILNGNGSGANITGLLQTSGIQTQAKGADTNADAIHKAITKIRSVGFFEPDGIVIHPTDWQLLRLAKDGNNQYYGGGPFTLGSYGQTGVFVDFFWGLPVVVTTAITAGTALVGAFKLGAQYFQRQGLTIESTNTDQDDFVKNLMTIRAELRGALAVYRPLAFCTVTDIA